MRNFLPPDHPATLGLQELLHPLREVTLEFLNIFQVIFFYSGLAAWAILPVFFAHFIGTNVDIFTGKKICHLAEDRF